MKQGMPFNQKVYKQTSNLITVHQAAELIGVHKNTIRRWEKEGKIKSTRVGNRKDRRFDKNALLKDILNIKIVDGKKEAYTKYHEYLKQLFKKAVQKNPVQFLYTTLQVSGMHYGHWDPTYEIYDFFEDFNQLLAEATNQNNLKRQYRIGLLMYCHGLEMSLPLNTLVNTLLVLDNKNYQIDPFFKLWKRKKGTIFGAVPPSAKSKINLLNKLAVTVGENELVKYIDEFYDDGVRNAFYHSDYCLTDTEFRYSDKGIATAVPLEKIDSLITKCFAFYEAFFHTHSWAKLFLGATKTYHKWPNYEVFEVLKNDKKEAYGFKVHFSNGQVAKFSREPEKVEAINLHFEDDGSINFFVGPIDELKSIWLVDGKPYIET